MAKQKPEQWITMYWHEVRDNIADGNYQIECFTTKRKAIADCEDSLAKGLRAFWGKLTEYKPTAKGKR